MIYNCLDLNMGDYERQQAHLLSLWKQMEDQEIEAIDANDSEEDNEIDNVSVCSDYPDLEQEGEQEGEQDVSVQDPRNKYYLGKDGLKWLKDYPNKTVRTRAENIITRLPGCKPYATQAKSALECFLLFFDNQMLLDIVSHTNQRIAEKSDKWKKSSHYRETTVPELKAVIGLLYLSGTFKSNHRHLYELWNTDGTGMEVFRATMSQRRFEFLVSCLRFDNKENRMERLSIDRLAHIRGLFERFVENCKAAYTPSQYLTIDEKLESFRGRCCFRQYMPNKPAKYGIKVHALVDARTFYVLNMEVYVGLQPVGPYRVSNSPKDIVDRLVAPVSGTHRNITFDNWYSSLELFIKLRETHKLTAVGTIRKNKRDIPPEFVNVKKRQVSSSLFGFQEAFTLVSYCPKKGKVALLLSSLHHDNSIDESEKKLPEMISFYNLTKGGVDVVDEMSATYSVARNSRRWPLTLFFSMLNSAGINSQIIYTANNDNCRIVRRLFLKKLGFELIDEHVRQRMESPRISRELRTVIRKILGENLEQLPKRSRPNQQSRCSECPRKRDRKTKYVCESCETFLCLEHALIYCSNCSDIANFNNE